MAMAEHNFQKPIFKSANQNLVDFSVNFKNWPQTKMKWQPTPSLNNTYTQNSTTLEKKSIDQSHLKTGINKQNLTHFEDELEPYGLEAPQELQVNTLSQHATNTNADRPKPMPLL